MKRILILLLALLPIASMAQRVPDNEEILSRTIDRSTPYYYPRLMERYIHGDTTLTLDEYHYLYYGFACQDSYKPTMSNDGTTSLYTSLVGLDADKPQTEQLQDIITSCLEALNGDPFSPMTLNTLVYAYGALGDKKNEEAYFYHLQGILETIKSSGDGRSEKYPMHIIMFSHAVDVVTSMGVESKRAQIISRNVEYIPLVTPRRVPDGKIKGFYFDYSRIYRNKPDDVTFKKKRTWQFNNLGVREYK